MENRAHAFAAGLFTLLLGAAVVFSLWWFSDHRESTREVLLVSTGSVNGLNPQANVRYRGILAGKVISIRLDPTNPQDLLVLVRIRADLPITAATRAKLASQGVTGIAFIALDDPGTQPALSTDEGAPSPRLRLERGTVEELADVGMQTLQRLRSLSDRLLDLSRPENLQRIDRSLAHLESASAGLDRSLQEAPRTLAAVRAVLSGDNLGRISRSLDNLEKASAGAGPLAGEAQALLGRLNTLSEHLDSSLVRTGDALNGGELARLPALLDELTTASRQLNNLAEELRAAPQSLVLGREKAPPGPGEAGFTPPKAPAR